MIEKTQNYEIFKKHPSNVSLIEGNVLKIVKSIQIRNLLIHRPILVDSKMQVIDGQHRLEAAKRLGVPIFYEIQGDLKSEDMRLLNENMRVWRKRDYVDFFSAEGSIEYSKLKRFMNKHNLSVESALTALNVHTISRANGSKTRQGRTSPLKEGLFIFPTDEEVKMCEEIITKTNRVLEYIIPKIDGSKAYLRGPKFRRAMFIFFSVRSFDIDLFMNKLSYRLDLVRPCTTLSESVRMLKNIYNWKNHNPITEDIL